MRGDGVRGATGASASIAPGVGYAVVLGTLVDRLWEVPAFEACLPLGRQWFLFGVGWVLIAVFVVLCGWVEDVAAGKKPRLLP